MNKDFLVFHQNVRGLRDKNNELFGSLLPELPHILCLTEHFLSNQEIICLTIDHYVLGAEFCRKTLKKGGTCIYVDETLNFSNINLKKFCIEQDIEACAVKINLLDTILYILSVYRSPNGNFRQFLKGIDNILNYLNKPNIEIIMCGDINVNYLSENCSKRQQLDNLLATYNLTNTINFPTRSTKDCASAINIYIDITHFEGYTVIPVVIGLSDHDAQVIKLENILMSKKMNEVKTMRNIDKYSINDFKFKLSYETWDDIFNENDVNKMFNNFHNTYLRIFYSCFLKKKIIVNKKENSWMTREIKISLNHERDLYLNIKYNNDQALKDSY
ncbi:uncharacterized protein LOC117282711 isoform X2 [Cryptotermes secundus]|uniref:uncharacterized protein LOC117282711 isoform X1 n=1 Tax=Cryptotermes secundus TaxID=105785 RepID=UPI001454BE98|nr:uncharacterized protein LOC117282711 isoform X1 [Cryptotermes secundus]XP_033609319.1 uncharacterized protein LOC117282711 isoform X2 [Cryptotermes secundus]